MPIVDDKTVISDIKSGVLAPIYFIFGNDTYLKQTYVKKLINAVVSEDDLFNFQKFSASSDLQDVYDAAWQLPIMQDKKCVVLSDFDFLKVSKDDFLKFNQLCEDACAETVLIFWFEWVDIDPKADRVKKVIDSIEKSKGRVVCLDHPSKTDLIRILTNGAKKRGCQMQPRVAQYIIESCSTDVSVLQSELDKLCAFVKQGEITVSTVDLVTVKSVEASVYDMAKKIISGRVSEAINLLDDLLYMRIDPIVILSNISSAYTDLYRAKAAQFSRVSPLNAAKEFSYGKRAFLLERAFGNLRKFDSKKLALSLKELTEADKNVKSLGEADRTVLEQLIVRLCHIAEKGDSID